MYKRSLFFLVSILAVLNLFGTISIQKGESAYIKGNYDEAIGVYEDALNEYGDSPQLLYNLGIAYYNNDDYGRAMLNFQRARRLDPSNKQINGNINYLKEKIEDANKAEQRGKRLNVLEDDLNFFQSIHRSIAENTTSNTWAVWGVVCFLLLIACVAVYIYSKNVLARKIGFFSGFILLGLSILFIVFSYLSAKAFETHEYAIVLSYKTALLTEPTEKSDIKEEPIVTRGTKVKVLSAETDAEGNPIWYKVRLNSDYIGWLKANEVEVI